MYLPPHKEEIPKVTPPEPLECGGCRDIGVCDGRCDPKVIADMSEAFNETRGQTFQIVDLCVRCSGAGHLSSACPR